MSDAQQFSPQLLARKVVLVDEQDQVIGEKNLVEAHRGEGLLHRASSVFLFRKNGDQLELLIQQRSPQKIVAGEQWANTACGNVAPGQSYLDCAMSRLEIELGITDVSLTELTKFRYQARCSEEFSENEITTIFAGVYDGEVEVNQEQVVQTQWVSWEKLLEEGLNGQLILSNQRGTLSPWLRLMINDPAVTTIIKTYLEGAFS